MINLYLLNRALMDANVSDSQFRVLYLIANNCSMNGADSIEMYNAFIGDKLHCSESTVQRSTKGLEENGYIKIQRATKKKTPNIISLVPILNDRTDETGFEGRNDTLNNIRKNNKKGFNINGMLDIEDGVSERRDIQETTSKQSVDWTCFNSKVDEYKKSLMNAQEASSQHYYSKKMEELFTFAEKHMSKDKFQTFKSNYDRWLEKTKPHFRFKPQAQGTPSKTFSDLDWESYGLTLRCQPELRKQTAREMRQYLQDCGMSNGQFLQDLKEQYGIELY